MKLSSVAALASLLVPAGTMPSQQHSPSKKSPNFLFILTDDLDYQLNSPAYLPSTLSRVKDKGVELANHSSPQPYAVPLGSVCGLAVRPTTPMSRTWILLGVSKP